MLQKIDLKEKVFKTNRYEIFCRISESKKKKSLILVHGLGLSGFYFIPIAKILALKYNVYLPDMPGFGNSPKPNRIFSLKDHSHVLEELMDTLKIKRAIFLGNSFGCQIIAQLAVSSSKKVQSIIFVGPTVNPDDRNVFEQLKALLYDAVLESNWQRRASIKDYYKAGIIQLIKTIFISINDKIEEKLPKIKVSVLVIRGTEDPFVPESWGREVAALLENSNYVEIEGKGHTLNSNSPVRLAKEIEHFLLKHDQ